VFLKRNSKQLLDQLTETEETNTWIYT